MLPKMLSIPSESHGLSADHPSTYERDMACFAVHVCAHQPLYLHWFVCWYLLDQKQAACGDAA